MLKRLLRIAVFIAVAAVFAGCALLSHRLPREIAEGVPEMSEELLSKIDPEALAWFQEHPNEYRSLMFQWNIEEYPSAANNSKLRELEERLAEVSAPLGRYVEEHHARGTLSTKNPEYQRLLSESEKATDALSGERRKLMDEWQKRYDEIIGPLQARAYAQLETIEGVKVTILGPAKHTLPYVEAKAFALKDIAPIPEIRHVRIEEKVIEFLNISSEVTRATLVHSGPPINYGGGAIVAKPDR